MTGTAPTKLKRRQDFVQDLVNKWAVPDTRPYDITLCRNAYEQKVLERDLFSLSEKRLRALRKLAYEKRMFIHSLRAKNRGLHSVVSKLKLGAMDKNFALDFAMFTQTEGTQALTADEKFLLTEEVFQQKQEKIERENFETSCRKKTKDFQQYCSSFPRQGRFSPITQEDFQLDLRSQSSASNRSTSSGLPTLGSGRILSQNTGRFSGSRVGSYEGVMSKFGSSSLQTINDSWNRLGWRILNPTFSCH